jgi:rhamnosyl/mannosyltransferase
MDDPQHRLQGEDAEVIRSSLGGRPMVFSLGRMTGYKGFEYLIDAAEHLTEDATIVVGGAGELLSTHRAAVQARGLGDRIRFVGRLDDASVAAHFAACEVFVLPSILRSEAYGMVLLEAMAASKPVVATDIPGSGVSWVNQDGVTGYNVPVRDGAALAHAIDELLRDPARAAALGRAGRSRYERELTADRMVEACLRLYERLLSRTSDSQASVPKETTA